MNKRIQKKVAAEASLKEMLEESEKHVDALHRDMMILRGEVTTYKSLLHRLPIMSFWKLWPDAVDGKYIIYWRDREKHPHCRIVDKRGGVVFKNESQELFPIDRIKPVAFLQLPCFPECLN